MLLLSDVLRWKYCMLCGAVTTSRIYFQGISCAAPLGITVATLFAGKLAVRIGRMQSVLICKTIGIGLLIALVYVPIHGPMGVGPWGAVAIYLVRTAFSNATQVPSPPLALHS